MAYGKKVGPQLPFQASLRGTGPPTPVLIAGLCCAASVAFASGTVSYAAQAVAPLSVVAYANPVESDTDSGVVAAALVAFGAGQVSYSASGLSVPGLAAIGDGSLISAPVGGIVRVVGPGLPFQARQLSNVVVLPSTPIPADGIAVGSSAALAALSVDTATYVGLPIPQQWGPAFLFTSGPRGFPAPQILTVNGIATSEATAYGSATTAAQLAGVAAASSTVLSGSATSSAASGVAAVSSIAVGDLAFGVMDGRAVASFNAYADLTIVFALPPPVVVTGQVPGFVPRDTAPKKKRKARKSGPVMREDQVFGEEYPVSPALKAEGEQAQTRKAKSYRAELLALMKELL